MQFLQKIPPWCDKMPKINLRDRGFIGLRKWNLGVVTSQEEANCECLKTKKGLKYKLFITELETLLDSTYPLKILPRTSTSF